MAVGEPTSNSWRRTDPTTVMIASLAPKGARKDSHSMETSAPNVTSACFWASSTPSKAAFETGLARCSEHFFPGRISLLHSTGFPPRPPSLPSGVASPSRHCFAPPSERSSWWNQYERSTLFTTCRGADTNYSSSENMDSVHLFSCSTKPCCSRLGRLNAL